MSQVYQQATEPARARAGDFWVQPDGTTQLCVAPAQGGGGATWETVGDSTHAHVTGAGTAGFVPRWTGTGALGNSLLYQDTTFRDLVTTQASTTVAADLATFIVNSTLGTESVTVDSALHLASAGFAPGLNAIRVNGTYGTPTKTLANNALFTLVTSGWSGTAAVTGPSLTAFTVTDSDAASPSYLLSIYGNSDLDTIRLGVSATPELVITNGRATVNGDVVLANGAVPAANSAGVAGQLRAAGGALYFAIGTNSWKKVTLETI